MKREDFLRELIHKSWHRGCKETDILLGKFARSLLSQMDEDFINVYCVFIAESDWDIYAWLVNEKPAPEQYFTVIAEIQKFHHSGGAMFF